MPILEPLIKPYEVTINQVGVIQSTVAWSLRPALVVWVPGLGDTGAKGWMQRVVGCVDAPVVVGQNRGSVEEIVAHEEHIEAQIHRNDRVAKHISSGLQGQNT